MLNQKQGLLWQSDLDFNSNSEVSSLVSYGMRLNYLSLKLIFHYMCRYHMQGSKICHPEICLFGMKIKLIIFQAQKTQEKSYTFHLSTQKSVDQRSCSRKDAITIDNHNMSQMWQTGRTLAKFVKIPLCVQLFLYGSANICLSNISSPCELPFSPLKT